MNDPGIEIAIDELALVGLPPQDGARLRAALIAELTRLLGASAPATLRAAAAVLHLDGGTLTMAPGETPEGIGATIAQAVYGRLGGRT